MKQSLKKALEAILGNPMAVSAARAIRPMDGVILAYHNIIEPGSPAAGDRSLHLTLDKFLAQVDWLGDFCSFTDLPDLLGGTPGTRPKVVMTFDDAYHGAVHLGIPELQQRGVPATIFVCSRWEGGELPWWDALADRHGGLRAEVRREALDSRHGHGPEVMEWARESGMAPAELPRQFRIASPAEVSTLLEGGGVSLGMHGTAHANLCSLTDDELEVELLAARRETRASYPTAIDWLAYPYGLTNDRVAARASAAGFEGALEVSGGPIRDARLVDRFRIPRLNVPAGASLRGFRLRSVGVL